MAKSNGLGDNLFVHGIDASGDVGAVNTIAGRKAVLDVTAINASAVERIGALGDGEISWNAFWNDGAAASRAAAAGSTFYQFSSLPTTDIVVTYCRGTTLGNPAACLSAKQVNYDPTRGNDASLMATIQALASAGSPLDWCKQVTAGKVTHASATTSTGYVDTAGTTAGGVGYLQYFSRSSGTPTFIIQHSSDTTDGTDGTWATLLTFAVTGGTAAFGERKEVTGTVNKGIRAQTTGTFSNAIFAMAFRRGTTVDDKSLA